MKIRFIFLAIVFSTFLSCNNKHKSNTDIPAGWIKNPLPNGWIIYAPANFTCKPAQGIDSEPGYIYSSKDSIYLQFDSGRKMVKNEGCSLTDDFLKAKASVDIGFNKHFFYIGTTSVASIDTIDNNIAIIIKPFKDVTGTINIQISDCGSGTWLDITGNNLSPLKQKLILKIFKTIRRN